MVRINPNVMSHGLNINPNHQPIRQKKRSMDAHRYEAFKDEVNKLLKCKFIRELFYPNWLSNPILVPKSNGKWRTCIDVINLNKAHPKDSFLLPCIDQLVDMTSSHELLSFMDAYSRYNQNVMFKLDEKHTSFITDR